MNVTVGRAIALVVLVLAILLVVLGRMDLLIGALLALLAFAIVVS
jgi:hypothetical protein